MEDEIKGAQVGLQDWSYNRRKGESGVDMALLVLLLLMSKILTLI